MYVPVSHLFILDARLFALPSDKVAWRRSFSQAFDFPRLGPESLPVESSAREGSKQTAILLRLCLIYGMCVSFNLLYTRVYAFDNGSHSYISDFMPLI